MRVLARLLFVLSLASGVVVAAPARADESAAHVDTAARAPSQADPPAAAADAPPCAELKADTSASVDDSLPGRVKAAIARGDMGVALILVLLGGLLTALSPCVYPLIPITLSILGARQSSSAFRGFLLSATYVSGMVILYSTLGVAFAALGFLAGSALQSPVVTIGVALFCMVMAASMFGAFELALPAGLQTRLSQAGGQGFRGAFIMGLVAGIIAAPCTGPVLSFILTLIARDGSIVKGAALMFMYALGMGLPFLVLGTFSTAIARMPKSGAWMEVVKSVFGLLMLGAGLYYLHIGVPAIAAATSSLSSLGVWLGPVLLVAGVAMGALHLSFKYTNALEKMRKTIGVALATVGLVVVIASLTTDAAPAHTNSEGIAWTRITGTPDALERFNGALATAQKSCKPVMIDFFADWCIACKELDAHTYVDDNVQHEAARFATVKVDATNDSPMLDSIQKRYGIVGLPTVVFIDSHGRTLVDPYVTGFVAPAEYLTLMQRVH